MGRRVVLLWLMVCGCGRLRFDELPTTTDGSSTTDPLSYACSKRVLLRGIANPPNAPLGATNGATFSVSPALPAGLVLDARTGIISGDPSTITPMTAYTITQTTPTGSSVSTVELRTADGYLANDMSDAPNVGPGCQTAAGTCTLRAAVEAINAASTPNVILLAPGTITLTLGQLSVTRDMDFYGDCAQRTTVSGNSATRVFQIAAASSLTSLVLQDSRGADGGAVRLGPPGPYTLDDLVFQNNTATVDRGGGVNIVGGTVAATVRRSTFRNNVAQVSGGGLAVYQNDGVVTISDCFFENNIAITDAGGGVSLSFAMNIDVSNSLFVGNTAGANGGGFDTNSATGNVTVASCTFYNNRATMSGGGIFINSPQERVTNSTIVGNHAAATQGGGFGTNCSGCAILTNNLFFQNDSGNSPPAPDTCDSGVLVSGGGNMFDTGVTDCANFTQPTDRPLVSAPGVGMLQDAGGPTKTMPLMVGSPAVGGAVLMACPPTDQRGLARLTDGMCDVGAYELQP